MQNNGMGFATEKIQILSRIALCATVCFACISRAAGEDEDAVQNEPDPVVLPPLMSAEIRLMARVCELSPEQCQTLEVQARKAVRLGKGTVEEAAIVERARPELVFLLKNITPQAFERFSAERVRLERRERRAAVMLQVSSLDSALCLTSEQRQKLCESLPEPASWEAGMRWPPLALMPGISQLPDVVSSGDLHCPPLSRQLKIRDTVTFQQAAAFSQLAFQNPGWSQIMSGDVRQRLIGKPPPLNDQRRRLNALLDCSIEFANAACRLSELQGGKLRAVGKLDIERYAERHHAADANKVREIANWYQLLMLSANAFSIFQRADSNYQRLLRSRLDDDQQRSLAAAESERQDFHKQALVEAVVVGFQRFAALTYAECDALAKRLRQSLAASRAPLHQRSAWITAITEIPEKEIESLFDGEQWPLARSQIGRLRDAAEFLKRQESHDW